MTFVLYHNDEDGFGAAYAAYKKLGPNAIYLGLDYGDSIPYLSDNADVYMLDYSMSREEIEELKSHVASLIVIDHHKTAEEALGDLPYVYINQEHSAAVLAWQYFHPTQEVPRLLRYVEDMDLRHWKLQDSKSFFYYLCSEKRAFDTWDELMVAMEKSDYLLLPAFTVGLHIKRFADAQVDKILQRSYTLLKIGDHLIPAINSSIFQWELHEELLKVTPSPVCVATYYAIDYGYFNVSLASDGIFDVSAIAKSYGGGGHSNAAAFSVETDAMVELLVISK